MGVGIPYAPISPAYSLLSTDFGKLRAIIELLTPGLVFANDGGPFARAIAAAVPSAAELVVTRNPPGNRKATLFANLVGAEDDCEIPVHFRLHRKPQGRHQHPAHAVLEPSDDWRRLRLRRRRVAGGGGLAAVEPHLRQQPQLQHGAGQRRLALYRRRQPDAAGRAEDRA